MKVEQLPIGSYYLVGERGLQQVNLDSSTCLSLTAKSPTHILSKDLQAWAKQAKHMSTFKLNHDESLVALDHRNFQEPQNGIPTAGRIRYFAVSPAGRFVEINMDSQSCRALTTNFPANTLTKDLYTWGLAAGHGAALPITDTYAISLVAFDIEALKLGIEQTKPEFSIA
jgi:hypothetical protein